MLTNNRSLLPEMPVKPEYESLLTDFHKIEQIPYTQDTDIQLHIIDKADSKASLDVINDKITATGDFRNLTEQTRDLRYTLFGNEGLVFRQTLKVLEDKYDIFSFHACAMYQPGQNRIFLIIGSAGSGKSCFMLKGLEMDLQLLSAEMGHFEITDDKLIFYKGAIVDNIRIGNLKHNYPNVLDKLNIQLPATDNEWGKKIALDFNRFQTECDEIVNPNLVIILPRVEQGRKEYFCQQEENKRKVSRILFENASEKIGQSILLYETIPFVCVDNPQFAKKRLDAVNALLEHQSLKKIVSVVSGPEDCWGDLVK